MMGAIDGLLTRTSTRSPHALVASATALVLLLAWNPRGSAPTWSGKSAVLLVTGLASLAFLPALWRSGAAKQVALASSFLASATVSTFLSDEPVAALVGLYNWGTGLLFVAALVGAWALGAAASASGGRDLLIRTVALGLIVNCALAIAQVVFELRTLDSASGAIGLAGSANHLGALAAALVALAAWRVSATPWWLLAVVLGAAAAQASGSRAGSGIAILLGALAAARSRGWMRLFLVGAVLGGLTVGVLAADVSGSPSALERTGNLTSGASGGGGLAIRAEVWKLGAQAIPERPLLGAGPGRFRAATSHGQSVALARAEGHDVLYADGHNLLVEYAVTTGLLGAVLLTAWLIAAAQGASGPLAAASLSIFGAALVGPQFASVTPLAFLLLGASAAQSRPARLRTSETVVGVTVGVAALLAAGALLVGDAALLRGLNQADLDVARQADRLLRPWPAPAAALGAIYGAGPAGVPEERAKRLSLAWWGAAISRDPVDPGLWNGLGVARLRGGDHIAARRAFLTALRHNPWSVSALRGLAAVDEARGDREKAIAWLERSLRVDADPAARKELARLQTSAADEAFAGHERPATNSLRHT